jgi:hypothetical protein
MPWFSEIQAESRIIPQKWQAWRQAAKVRNSPESNDNPVGVAVAASVSHPLGSDVVFT